MNNQLQIFKSEQFGQVRIALLNEDPIFNLYDVCFDLGYTKTDGRKLYLRKELIENTCETLGIKGLSLTDRETQITKDTDFENTWISEENFYDLCLESKAKNARAFRKWVTSEVLPSIRKTGGYVNNEDLFINTYLPYVDENTKLVFRNTLSMVRKQNEIIAIQKSTIDKQEKEIDHKQGVIVGLVDEITLAEKRQILNRVVRYKGAKFQERWRELYKQFSMKYHIDLEYQLEKYNKDHKPKLKNKVDYIDKVMNKIPELYEIACKLYENDVKELAKSLYSLSEEVI